MIIQGHSYMYITCHGNDSIFWHEFFHEYILQTLSMNVSNFIIFRILRSKM